MFDIGGGSSELIWLDLARLDRPWRRTLHDRLDVQSCIAAWTSLPIGVVSLAERHGGREVTRASYEAMVADVMASLQDFEKEHRFGARIATKRAPFPRHLWHGHHHRRHPSQAADVRSLAGRRMLAQRARRAHRFQ